MKSKAPAHDIVSEALPYDRAAEERAAAHYTTLHHARLIPFTGELTRADTRKYLALTLDSPIRVDASIEGRRVNWSKRIRGETGVERVMVPLSDASCLGATYLASYIDERAGIHDRNPSSGTIICDPPLRVRGEGVIRQGPNYATLDIVYLDLENVQTPVAALAQIKHMPRKAAAVPSIAVAM